ncbi:hypothetical protein ABZ905_08670 [Streptomyces parvus]|uniref:hypothetical protein n=1 Tax=Streptomyces parvus TaxID=66428 RepID=UPI0033E5F03D
MYGDTWVGDVDLVAVERAASLRGDCPELQPAEVLEAVRVMAGRGMSDVAIGRRLGLSDKTVMRRRVDMEPVTGPRSDNVRTVSGHGPDVRV